ncbi:hypothetical protein [Streptosporangium sp. NPDC006007]|uniref:hypothetical protein n=1 Tax=Streptosporangium sp. NPDC006007 TaxID=3154575 RepID=UPI0033ACD3C9
MDLTRRLRPLQDAYDQAAADYAAARRTFESARNAYDSRRRYAPTGAETERARAAWAMAGHEWMRALVAREMARDQLASERRDVDQAAADHFLTPTRRSR